MAGVGTAAQLARGPCSEGGSGGEAVGVRGPPCSWSREQYWAMLGSYGYRVLWGEQRCHGATP